VIANSNISYTPDLEKNHKRGRMNRVSHGKAPGTEQFSHKRPSREADVQESSESEIDGWVQSSYRPTSSCDGRHSAASFGISVPASKQIPQRRSYSMPTPSITSEALSKVIQTSVRASRGKADLVNDSHTPDFEKNHKRGRLNRNLGVSYAGTEQVSRKSLSQEADLRKSIESETDQRHSAASFNSTSVLASEQVPLHGPYYPMPIPSITSESLPPFPMPNHPSEPEYGMFWGHLHPQVWQCTDFNLCLISCSIKRTS
jgi:hypothetical protein